MILSPRLRAIPWVLLRIRMYPLSFPSACFSMLILTNASSPKMLFAYKFAAKKPQSPSSADLKFNQPKEHLCQIPMEGHQTSQRVCYIIVICVECVDQNNSRCRKTLHIGRLDDMIQKILLTLNYCVHSDLKHKISARIFLEFIIYRNAPVIDVEEKCAETEIRIRKPFNNRVQEWRSNSETSSLETIP